MHAVPLRRAQVPAEYVALDMLGGGLLLAVPTPKGEALRLSRKCAEARAAGRGATKRRRL